MFDAGQLADEASAGRDDQMVGSVFAAIRDDKPAALGKAGHGGHDVIDPVLPEEMGQRYLQRFALAQPRRQPDRTWQIMQLVSRRDDHNLVLDAVAAQLTNGGQRSEA
jgi:hypothetical protein